MLTCGLLRSNFALAMVQPFILRACHQTQPYLAGDVLGLKHKIKRLMVNLSTFA
tara:strand:- start:688 stop:849 length:162 start_codon:yes stop_codon:yes gene_type:complete